MQMNSHIKLILLIITFLGCACLANTSPDQVLQSKGLIPVGDTYLLDIDAKSSDQIRDLTKVRSTMQHAAWKRDAIIVDIHRVDLKIAQWDSEVRDLQAKMEIARHHPESYNPLAEQDNQLLGYIRDAALYKAGREKDLQSMADGKDDYIAAVTKTSDLMEAGAAQYASLARDQAAKDAVAELNQQTKKNFKLGPSETWSQHLDFVRKLRSLIDSAVIPVEMGRGVPEVLVSLNDKPAGKMVFDSGSELISLNPATAKFIGLEPGPDDPVIKMKTASGKTVKAHLMTLKSVRVGQFTADNVQCVVMPAEAPDADDLLGGSFLEHFAYRMDLSARALHLTQIIAVPDDRNKSIATTLPASAPAKPQAAAVPQALPSNAANWEDIFSSLTGDTDHKDDGAIVLNTQTQHLSTAKAYPPAVTFKVIAMTDSTNIRLHYGGVRMAFNWEMHPNDLLIDGKPTGRAVQTGAGKVNTNQWLDIELKIESDRLTLSVDGEQRCSVPAKFTGIKDVLTLTTMSGANVKIKSVKVSQSPL
ncbi:MAG TPA: retroviral-like aspartic protease family protein [Tepidisphaeraceae bacterium]|jgi:aspartyl protease family protein|nr:retroviral-like aspartic protease family protein [Tepidisphaeraceae bacterium]